MANKINMFNSKLKKKNTISDKLIGVVLMIAGITIWSIDYFIVKALSSIGIWLATLMNAPAGVGIGITILISFACLGILLLVAFLGGCVFWIGFEYFKN